ncbi:uncharacterized protein FOMMEDRAFT_22887 [Fomitiporia mediterranea MF3/22]|uniref:uncharacterized protein n=1 Tax=Fomitiporia mediterranea (strain MF3/22) TaxID=694068 RepID=UPI0004408C3A|nr:uncharacterized protein FOMMEDRAFT_22887 [Fomitiporia mediterranea MF3/22]EJC99845.1 hypothetical protein FOMMEDRAFT_22887 [Fomitiporia mediterranea MF3/22]
MYRTGMTLSTASGSEYLSHEANVSPYLTHSICKNPGTLPSFARRNKSATSFAMYVSTASENSGLMLKMVREVTGPEISLYEAAILASP